MTREEARRLHLNEFLYYMIEDEKLQICFKGNEWDDFVELTKESKLLKPFMHCRVDCIGATLAEDEERPVIIISIDDSNMVYLGEGGGK